MFVDQLLLTYGISYFSHSQHKLRPGIKLRSIYFSLLFHGGAGTHEEMGTNSYVSGNQKGVGFHLGNSENTEFRENVKFNRSQEGPAPPE